MIHGKMMVQHRLCGDAGARREPYGLDELDRSNSKKLHFLYKAPWAQLEGRLPFFSLILKATRLRMDADRHPPMQLIMHLLAAQGFHIAHAFPVQLFNNSPGCPDEHQLPTFSRSSTLGVVIGNTNALWPHFVQHLSTHPAALSADNPFDQLVEATVTQAVQQCLSNLPSQAGQCVPPPSSHSQPANHGPTQPECSSSSNSASGTQQQPTIHSSSPQFAIRFSHHFEPGKFVNMMRAAQLSGLAYYSSTTHLCMHPTYGPWFALRAVAVFDVDGPDPAAFSQLPCPHPDLEAEAADKVRLWWGDGHAMMAGALAAHAQALLHKLHVNADALDSQSAPVQCPLRIRLHWTRGPKVWAQSNQHQPGWHSCVIFIYTLAVLAATPPLLRPCCRLCSPQMKALEQLGGFSNWQQHWRDWAALRSLGGKYTDPK